MRDNMYENRQKQTYNSVKPHLEFLAIEYRFHSLYTTHYHFKNNRDYKENKLGFLYKVPFFQLPLFGATLKTWGQAGEPRITVTTHLHRMYSLSSFFQITIPCPPCMIMHTQDLALTRSHFPLFLTYETIIGNGSYCGLRILLKHFRLYHCDFLVGLHRTVGLPGDK